MKKTIQLLLFLFLSASMLAQHLDWKAGVNFFFDNTEFARSAYTTDQTMAGVNLSPEIGVKWSTENTVFAGVNVLKKLGSASFSNNIQLLTYYQFQDKKTIFRAGAFLKENLLDDYSNFFFQDSITYYRPTIQGLYLKKGDKKHFVKLWLDWTGLQSDTIRESFFLGTSAYQQLNDHFFFDFQSYVFHYANTQPAHPEQNVCDNILAQLSAGYHYKNQSGLNKLIFSAGILAGFERNRKWKDDYSMPIGLVGKADLEYKEWGIENLLYAGEPRMKLYGSLGGNFYWGNPFLQGKFYLQNKIYWKVFDTKYVSGQLASRIHCCEKNIFFEQLFTLSANINK